MSITLHDEGRGLWKGGTDSRLVILTISEETSNRLNWAIITFNSCLISPPFKNGHISLFNLRGIRKVGVRDGHFWKIRTFHTTLSYLSPIISLQLANIIPAENCRDFRFHSGLDLLYLSSSLSWNILLSQPLSHHSYMLTYANWHRIVKGSSYRFIPPSCDLSSLRFGPGRIQKPVTRPGARTRKFSMSEMHSKRKDSWSAPLAEFANSTFQSWEKQAKLIGRLGSVRLEKELDQSTSRVGKRTTLPAL